MERGRVALQRLEDAVPARARHGDRTTYNNWNETNPNQNSLTQYIGMTSGVNNPSTVNDCKPSSTCHSMDNNIFRQVRAAHGTPRTYVEGPTTGCSATGNAAKHIPALYYWGGADRTYCTTEVRPITNLNPKALPTFAMIIPNTCHDGHDCSDASVDSYARTILTPILNGSNYRAGKTLVVVTYDEDRPVPNLFIAPTAHAGPISSITGSHAGLLKTVEAMLHLPLMNQGQLPTAPNLHAPPTSDGAAETADGRSGCDVYGVSAPVLSRASVSDMPFRTIASGSRPRSLLAYTDSDPPRLRTDLLTVLGDVRPAPSAVMR